MLAVFSGLAKLLSSLATEDGGCTRLQGTDCRWATFGELKLGVENGKCLCATSDTVAFCLNSGATAFDEDVFVTEDVTGCGLTFDDVALGVERGDEITEGVEDDNFCDVTFNDETVCRSAAFDDVTLGSEDDNCCMVTAGAAVVKGNC